jgi:subtilisin family serine protease
VGGQESELAPVLPGSVASTFMLLTFRSSYRSIGRSSLQTGRKVIARSILCSLIGVLIGIGPPQAYARVSFKTVRQMQVTYEGTPTLYWLDSADGSIHKSKAHSERLLLTVIPWIRFLHIRTPWHHSDVAAQSAMCRPRAFAVHGGTIFAVDDTTGNVCLFTGKHVAETFIPASPGSNPNSIAVSNNTLYLSDNKLNKVSAYSLSNRTLIQQFAVPDGPAPDRLLYSQGELVGVHLNPPIIYRLHIAESSLSTREGGEGAVLTTQAVHLDQSVPITDAALAGSLIYLLEPSERQIAAVPIYGTNVSSLSYRGIVSSPVAIAGTFDNVSRLVIADLQTHKFKVVQSVVPATIYLRGATAPRSLAAFYKYLLDRKLLPLQAYRVQQADQNLESILTTADVVPFGYSEQFEPLVCRLNHHECHDSRLVLRPGAQLLLPNLAPTMYAGRSAVRLSGNQTLREVVASANSGNLLVRGKPLTDEETAKLVSEMNRVSLPSKILDNTVGRYVIPVNSIRVTAWISERELKHKTRLRSELGSGAHIVTPIAHYKVAPASVVGLSSPASSEPDPFVPDWSKVVSLISIPPNDLIPSQVGVVDFGFNLGHPEFSSPGVSRWISPYRETASPPSSVAVIGDLKTVAVNGPDEPATDPPISVATVPQAPEDAHGTHVAALIGGRRVGVHPGTLIKAILVDDFSDALSHAGDTKIGIYNLSLGEKYYKDWSTRRPLLGSWKELIEDPANENILFVIAAGNDSTEIDNKMLASVGERSNAIVVGATDVAAAPHLWTDEDQVHGTNTSARWVNLLAPGSHVVSAGIFGYAWSSGTSQAAAIVSGAATLLIGKEPTWKPWQVKERLVSTSALMNSLNFQKSSQGGMLDIGRALSATRNIVFRLAGSDQECTASIAPSELTKSFNIEKNLPPVVYSNLRRIHKNDADGKSFTVMYSWIDPSGAGANDPDGGRRLLRPRQSVPREVLQAVTMQIIPESDASACADLHEINLGQVDELYNAPIITE